MLLKRERNKEDEVSSPVIAIPKKTENLIKIGAVYIIVIYLASVFLWFNCFVPFFYVDK